MSYDLHFIHRGQGTPPAVKDFTEYFRSRKNYKTSDAQAFYQSQTTGVYFAFNFGNPEGGEPRYLPASFNLNYFRPHIFGLEAEPELTAFIQQFKMLVFDPQNEGMGEGEYSAEGFLKGWNVGNEFGYKAILKQDPNQKLFTLPTAQIEACWRWNSSNKELENKHANEDVFVPRYMFLNIGGNIKTMVVWPDAIRIAMPAADRILIQRKTILQRKLSSPGADMVLIPMETLDDFFQKYSLEQEPIPYRLLNHRLAPPEIVSRLLQFQPIQEKLEGVSVDKILNAEIVQKVLSGT